MLLWPLVLAVQLISMELSLAMGEDYIELRSLDPVSWRVQFLDSASNRHAIEEDSYESPYVRIAVNSSSKHPISVLPSSDTVTYNILSHSESIGSSLSYDSNFTGPLLISKPPNSKPKFLIYSGNSVTLQASFNDYTKSWFLFHNDKVIRCGRSKLVNVWGLWRGLEYILVTYDSARVDVVLGGSSMYKVASTSSTSYVSIIDRISIMDAVLVDSSSIVNSTAIVKSVHSSYVYKNEEYRVDILNEGIFGVDKEAATYRLSGNRLVGIDFQGNSLNPPSPIHNSEDIFMVVDSEGNYIGQASMVIRINTSRPILLTEDDELGTPFELQWYTTDSGVEAALVNGEYLSLRLVSPNGEPLGISIGSPSSGAISFVMSPQVSFLLITVRDYYDISYVPILKVDDPPPRFYTPPRYSPVLVLSIGLPFCFIILPVCVHYLSIFVKKRRAGYKQVPGFEIAFASTNYRHYGGMDQPIE